MIKSLDKQVAAKHIFKMWYAREPSKVIPYFAYFLPPKFRDFFGHSLLEKTYQITEKQNPAADARFLTAFKLDRQHGNYSWCVVAFSEDFSCFDKRKSFRFLDTDELSCNQKQICPLNTRSSPIRKMLCCTLYVTKTRVWQDGVQLNSVFTIWIIQPILKCNIEDFFRYKT